ncbi:uncharacterized protein LOC142055576 [Phalacrocorax aristotelis]|uniref:uncharacterized protein LOC142055576 n=1 Tax=Phalacrocorax aristotelis TaxID=126867 RepID=UPI003F4B1596
MLPTASPPRLVGVFFGGVLTPPLLSQPRSRFKKGGKPATPSRGREKTGCYLGTRGERGAAGSGPAGSAEPAPFSPKTPGPGGESLRLPRRRVGEGRGRAGPATRPSPAPRAGPLGFFLLFINFFPFILPRPPLFFPLPFVVLLGLFCSGLGPTTPCPPRGGEFLPCPCHRGSAAAGTAAGTAAGPPACTRVGKIIYIYIYINWGKIKFPRPYFLERGETGSFGGDGGPSSTGHGHEWHRPGGAGVARGSPGCFPRGLEDAGRGGGDTRDVAPGHPWNAGVGGAGVCVSPRVSPAARCCDR